MKTIGLVGILLFAVGGSLFLDSLEYVMRISVMTSTNIDWFSFGTFTAFIALLIAGVGLHFIIESASQR